jgi:hypothetical protein
MSANGRNIFCCRTTLFYPVAVDFFDPYFFSLKNELTRFADQAVKQHFLNFFPEPQGQGSFRLVLGGAMNGSAIFEEGAGEFHGNEASSRDSSSKDSSSVSSGSGKLKSETELLALRKRS